MKIAFGCDHKGFILKQAILDFLAKEGHEVKDFGTYSTDSCDYPVFGRLVGKAVASGEFELGVLVCGTGCGIGLAADRVKGIRAVCCSDPYTAQLSRNHNNANVLAMGSMVVGEGLAIKIVEAFITSDFDGGRHLRRVNMLNEMQADDE